jgi:hypothetical protein
MSFYTQSLKTEIHDPRINVKNTRAEFRLQDEDAVYLSNLRLANIGITASPDEWNAAAGSLAVVDSIILYDDGTELCAMRDFDLYSAWKNYNKENAANKSINNFLVKNAMGYEVRGTNTSTTSENIEPLFPPPGYTLSETTTAQGWLDLKSCMPFLASVAYLPQQVFKNLRLVINYKAAIGTAQNTNAPILITDQMVDSSQKQKLVSAFKGVSYVSVLHDSFVVDAVSGLTTVAQTKTQEVSKMLKGYDNKMLNKLLVIFTPQTTDRETDNLGKLGSQMYLNQKVNLRVNGRNLLVGDGYDSPAKTLAGLTETYGTHNTYMNRIALQTSVLGTQPEAMLGQQSYVGFLVREYVEQMELQISRDGEYDDGKADQTQVRNNASFVVQTFGECPTTLEVQPDGTYLIAYTA